MAYTLEHLSYSTGGQPIVINAISSPGTFIHSGVAGTSQKDEIFLYANNTGTGLYNIALQIGDSGAANTVFAPVASQDGFTLICPGLPINSGFIIRAYAVSGNGYANPSGMLRVCGYVQRGP